MITSGVLLIEPEAPRPRCFEVDAHSPASAWTSVKYTLTPRQLEKELSATGWTFFFMAGPIRVRAFGFDREKTAGAALKRAIRAVRQQSCNCLQIESVEMRSFLGIPYAGLLVRPRHLQKGMLFAGPSIGAAADLTAYELRRHVPAT